VPRGLHVPNWGQISPTGDKICLLIFKAMSGERGGKAMTVATQGSGLVSAHLALQLAEHSICGCSCFSACCNGLSHNCAVIWLLGTADGTSAMVKKHVCVVAAHV
jgi:hypothetical protein